MTRSRNLFIRASAFGDVLLTTPFRRQLLAADPGAEVDLYTLHEQAWAPGPGRTFSMKTRSLKAMLEGGYDRIHGFFYENHLALHILDAYALSSGLEPGDRTLDWTVLPEEDARARTLLGGLKGPIIGIHPASGSATRSLGPVLTRRIVQRLREELGAAVVVTGQQPLGLEGCLDLSGRLGSLRDLGALLARMDGFITVDSGPFHIAQAIGTPTAAFFGCTLPELRVTRTRGLQVLLKPGLPCLGCYHGMAAGSEALALCARGDLACLEAWEAVEVVAALKRAMEGGTDRVLEERIDRYGERLPSLLAATPGREETLLLFQRHLERQERRLGGFKRFRRRLRALIST